MCNIEILYDCIIKLIFMRFYNVFVSFVRIYIIIIFVIVKLIYIYSMLYFFRGYEILN